LGKKYCLGNCFFKLLIWSSIEEFQVVFVSGLDEVNAGELLAMVGARMEAGNSCKSG
jgi:hypothetical protein